MACLENSERIANIIVNPKNSNEIFVAVLGALWSDSNERGVYKSSDGGVTWENILYLNNSTGCADLAMDPSNPKILYDLEITKFIAKIFTVNPNDGSAPFIVFFAFTIALSAFLRLSTLFLINRVSALVGNDISVKTFSKTK